MGKIILEKPVREAMVQGLTRYLKDELDVEVSGFDAQFLLDFISERLGPHYYNQGLYDAQALLAAKLDALGEAVLELERPVKP